MTTQLIGDREKPEPNAPLLLKTLEWIEHHPEELEQEHWGCGTRGCFAFHAALIDGGEVIADHYFRAEEDDPAHLLIPFTVGDAIGVPHRARRILGINEEQADRLFAGSNNIDDLRAEVYRLVGDWNRLAEHTERMLINYIDGAVVQPSAYADPELDLDDKHLLWQDAADAIGEWQKALDGDVDYGSLEPAWRDAETYANHCRGLVEDAVRKLIGGTA